MTIYAFEAQESWLPTVIGMPCSAVEFDEDEGLLTLLFGRVNERGDVLEADRAVSLTGVWRVERGDEIIAASGDLEDPGRSERLQYLDGNNLIQADVSRPGFDLALHLSGGYVVRCFPCDSLQYSEDPPEGEEIFVAWWVDGVGVPDDWEEPNAAFYEEQANG